MINQIEPWIGESEIKEVINCIKSTFVTEGLYTEKFEKIVGKLHKTKTQPIAYANATVALYASLKVLGIRPGNEVIIPSITFIATANAVIMAGGIPVCVDVDENFNMLADQVKEVINSKTFAIMPVHLYGHFCNAEELLTICNENSLHLIEDASQGIGVTKDGYLYAGCVGEIGVLSFYGNKFVTSAQGGMIICKNDFVAKKLKQFKNHGRQKKGTFWHEEIGFNFCTSDLHSALGYSQLSRFEEIRNRKHEIFEFYKKNLECDDLKLDEIESNYPAYWFISIKTKKLKAIENALEKNNIGSRRAFPPLNLQPCFKGSKIIKFISSQNAEYLFDTYLSLPSSASLSNDQISKICDVINNS